MQPIDPLAWTPATQPRTAALPGSITLDAKLPLASLSVGQEVSARMLSDRPGGRFVALIEGRQIEIALPAGARAGDSLKLTVIADQPRLLLAPSGAGSAAISSAGTSLSRESAPTAAAGLLTDAKAGDIATPSLTGREVVVSAAGRALGRLVGDIASAAREGGGRPASLGGGTSAAPLVALPSNQPAVLSGQLATALAKSLAGSGLFYESHQAQWIAGRRSLEALRGEPQGRLAPLVPRLEGESMAARASALAAAQASAEPARAVVATLARDAAALLQPVSQTIGSMAGSALDATVDPAAALLVQQQLTALDTGAASWSGQVLPGMQARLTVQEQAQQDEGDGEGPEAGWATRLSVSLPRLGAVDAQLLLRGDRLVLAVTTGDATSSAELGAARERLLETLAAAGLQVDSLQVMLR